MDVLKYKGLDRDPRQLHESVQVQLPKASDISLHESVADDFVMPKIEVIHAGRTANYVHYPSERLKGDASLNSGVYSWTEPYGKPVIYNHDLDTDVTGRVVRAAYADYTEAGRPGLIVVPKISEPNAVKAIMDERLLTVSIGATTNAAICSICGTDIVEEGFCGHMKGEEYDGQTAEWIVGDVFFQELSWVNLPADEHAKVTDKQTSLIASGSDAPADTQEAHAYYQLPKSATIIESVAKSTSEEGSHSMKNENTYTEFEEENKDQEPQEPQQTPEKDPDAPSVNEPTSDEEPQAPSANEPEGTPNDPPETPESTEDPEPNDSEEGESGEKDSEEGESTEDEKPEDETPEDTETNDEAPEDGETPPQEEEPNVNESLENQVSTLTDELRQMYIQKVIEAANIQEEEAKENFRGRLEERSLEVLKQNYEDLKEGFFGVQPTAKPQKRQVKKVENPIQTEEEKDAGQDAQLNESERVDQISSLFRFRSK